MKNVQEGDQRALSIFRYRLDAINKDLLFDKQAITICLQLLVLMHVECKKAFQFWKAFLCRDGKIRTCDLLVPNQAR